jgi:hypothetical protein
LQRKSTGKVKKNDGVKQFLNKCVVRLSMFDRYYLQRGQPANTLAFTEPEDTRELRWQLLRSRLKRSLGWCSAERGTACEHGLPIE